MLSQLRSYFSIENPSLKEDNLPRMPSRESIPEELVVLRDKITTAHDIRMAGVNAPQDTVANRAEKYNGYTKDTKVVRAEYPVIVPDELIALMGRVTAVRNFVFDHGQDFTRHPDYAQMNPFFATEESEMRHRETFWHKVGEFRMHATPLPGIFNIIPGVEPDAPLNMYTATSEAHAEKFTSWTEHSYTFFW